MAPKNEKKIRVREKHPDTKLGRKRDSWGNGKNSMTERVADFHKEDQPTSLSKQNGKGGHGRTESCLGWNGPDVLPTSFWGGRVQPKPKIFIWLTWFVQWTGGTLGLGGCWILRTSLATDNPAHSVRRLASKAICSSPVGRQSKISKWCQILSIASMGEWTLASLKKFRVFKNGNRWASRKKSKRQDGDTSPQPLWMSPTLDVPFGGKLRFQFTGGWCFDHGSCVLWLHKQKLSWPCGAFVLLFFLLVTSFYLDKFFLPVVLRYNWHTALYNPGFPFTSGKEPPCQFRRPKRRRFDPWVGKIPCRRKWQFTPVFLPGESNGKRSLTGFIP